MGHVPHPDDRGLAYTVSQKETYVSGLRKSWKIADLAPGAESLMLSLLQANVDQDLQREGRFQ